MYPVGKLLSQGLSNVSSPFHPFGGAIDIILVQHEDGKYQSTPWYVRFGNFQGVFKRRGKTVNITVNDQEVPFHMYLDSNGEAFFLRDAKEGESNIEMVDETTSDEILSKIEPLLLEYVSDMDGNTSKNSSAHSEASLNISLSSRNLADDNSSLGRSNRSMNSDFWKDDSNRDLTNSDAEFSFTVSEKIRDSPETGSTPSSDFASPSKPLENDAHKNSKEELVQLAATIDSTTALLASATKDAVSGHSPGSKTFNSNSDSPIGSKHFPESKLPVDSFHSSYSTQIHSDYFSELSNLSDDFLSSIQNSHVDTNSDSKFENGNRTEGSDANVKSKIVDPFGSDFGHFVVDQSSVGMDPKFKLLVEKEKAWRDVIEKSAVVLKSTPYSSESYEKTQEKASLIKSTSNKGWGWWGLVSNRNNEPPKKNNVPDDHLQQEPKNDNAVITEGVEKEKKEIGNEEEIDIKEEKEKQGEKKEDKESENVEDKENEKEEEKEMQEVVESKEEMQAALIVDLLDTQWTTPISKPHKSNDKDSKHKNSSFFGKFIHSSHSQPHVDSTHSHSNTPPLPSASPPLLEPSSPLPSSSSATAESTTSSSSTLAPTASSSSSSSSSISASSPSSSSISVSSSSSLPSITISSSSSLTDSASSTPPSSTSSSAPLLNDQSSPSLPSQSSSLNNLSKPLETPTHELSTNSSRDPVDQALIISHPSSLPVSPKFPSEIETLNTDQPIEINQQASVENDLNQSLSVETKTQDASNNEQEKGDDVVNDKKIQNSDTEIGTDLSLSNETFVDGIKPYPSEMAHLCNLSSPSASPVPKKILPFADSSSGNPESPSLSSNDGAAALSLPSFDPEHSKEIPESIQKEESTLIDSDKEYRNETTDKIFELIEEKEQGVARSIQNEAEEGQLENEEVVLLTSDGHVVVAKVAEEDLVDDHEYGFQGEISDLRTQDPSHDSGNRDSHEHVHESRDIHDNDHTSKNAKIMEHGNVDVHSDGNLLTIQIHEENQTESKIVDVDHDNSPQPPLESLDPESIGVTQNSIQSITIHKESFQSKISEVAEISPIVTSDSIVTNEPEEGNQVQNIEAGFEEIESGNLTVGVEQVNLNNTESSEIVVKEVKDFVDLEFEFPTKNNPEENKKTDLSETKSSDIDGEKSKLLDMHITAEPESKVDGESISFEEEKIVEKETSKEDIEIIHAMENIENDRPTVEINEKKAETESENAPEVEKRSEVDVGNSENEPIPNRIGKRVWETKGEDGTVIRFASFGSLSELAGAETIGVWRKRTNLEGEEEEDEVEDDGIAVEDSDGDDILSSDEEERFKSCEASMVGMNDMVQDDLAGMTEYMEEDTNKERVKLESNKPTSMKISELDMGSGSTKFFDAQSSVANSELPQDTSQIVSLGLELSLCRHLLFERMGKEAAEKAFDTGRVSMEQFRQNPSKITNNDRLIVRIDGSYYPWKTAAPRILSMLAFGVLIPPIELDRDGAIKVEKPEPKSISQTNSGTSLAISRPDSIQSISRPGWILWPFSGGKDEKTKSNEELDRSKVFSSKNIIATKLPQSFILSAAEAALKGPLPKNIRIGPNGFYSVQRKPKVRSLKPTAEQLALLPLKPGKNKITFSFHTRVLGKQQVDCSIYVWKWNTRVVISDVDGTITKSDVLGQVMPLVGKDWSQTGVARLFSAIKENGYELLFLSARAITQAHLTRTFLFNLKQDNHSLPEGPVVISPDGLFPSLYREVIRRAPHEFKIACLNEIKSVFPADYNPFYAGFGNRDTDEISYQAVGIPKGKIFIINPKGEIVLNNFVDIKSYSSLHSLVHDIFPNLNLHSLPVLEDYNAWNYWKTPLPDIMDDLDEALLGGGNKPNGSEKEFKRTSSWRSKPITSNDSSKSAV